MASQRLSSRRCGDECASASCGAAGTFRQAGTALTVGTAAGVKAASRDGAADCGARLGEMRHASWLAACGLRLAARGSRGDRAGAAKALSSRYYRAETTIPHQAHQPSTTPSFLLLSTLSFALALAFVSLFSSPSS
ncbi:hypothetical protein CC85DRAFT_117991 [Cutaneotrichosporon oleaginosum]|uniref:Uncharacterized protein n=1 Tax=Cutaneotrichosporon oleaginosum TaxID=879819 RepID=A0A0J0XKA1_9TREE|nr:uncharacterized protein CC85DRAFT_117991 [Cutaneotrichosporon oleaginosum]KLT41543.1 hypothetical protein CC85DRAFT_117991 [Cutaneotrichosporon oleaginosum]TXT09311.1 hypothetical protein COLE_03245 [Cutaneotrichosporon oleaginosum]